MYSQSHIDKVTHDARYNGAEVLTKWTKKRFVEKLRKVVMDPEVMAILEKQVKLHVLQQRLLKYYDSLPTSVYGNHTKFFVLSEDAAHLTKEDVMDMVRASKIPRTGKWECEYLEWSKIGTKYYPTKKTGIASIDGDYACFGFGVIKRTDSSGFKFLRKIEDEKKF